jgi:predicted enzyme related to lactoylglutathione lyase
MPARDHAPVGSPCWADLWTSDVDGSRRFYSELFGWKAEEPSPEFGGYFMFTASGIPVAGAMGDMGEMRAQNLWKVFLTTDDMTKTIAAAEAEGATIVAPPMAIADLGVQAVLNDPTGAHLGVWQPGSFPGFTVLNEPGTPSWFELMTRDHAGAVAFYRSVFHWQIESVSDTDEFRYTAMRDPSSDGQLAGIMDASGFLPAGVPAHWSVYWGVQDAADAAVQVKALGGSVVRDAEDTPYGRIATVADPAGAQFKLHSPNR